MKNSKPLLFTVLFALLASLFSYAQDSSLERTWRKDVEKIRIISYNILDGFDELTDTDRMNRMVNWIKSKDPEVMALQELVGFKEKDLQDFGKSYGHPHAAILKEEGYPVGITSKRPIEVVNKFVDGYWHGMLHVRTYGMDFIILHLSPSDAKIRKEEADKITAYILENKLENCLVMGDFNSVSPFDGTQLDKRNYRSRTGFIDYSIQATFLATPLVDICQMYTLPEKRNTCPTRISYNVSKREDMHDKTGSRIDFILTTPPLLPKCVDAFIWNGADTDYLSDHYPVGIDMVLTKEGAK